MQIDENEIRNYDYVGELKGENNDRITRMHVCRKDTKE